VENDTEQKSDQKWEEKLTAGAVQWDGMDT
jgi:hypothetical protein